MTNVIQVKLYPRLSIDNARRVRQLSHSLNGQVCSRCGKRTAKYLPKIAAPWLAGTYDGDRAASKAALEALTGVFPSPEKVAGLRKTFHEPVLEYCRDAVLHETVQTLSDERTVSKDDAQATFARVVATSLAVISSLLSTLAEEEVSKQYHIYEQLFGDAKLWDFASHSDAAVRRSLHRLVQAALAKQSSLIEANLKSASTSYISKGLPSDQTASALDFVATVHSLTSVFPQVWTQAYHGKKPAASRLKQFMKHGSGSGSSDFWERTNQLLTKVPEAVLPSEFDEVRDLLFAARDGVTRKEERFVASTAWPAYFTLVFRVSLRLALEEREKLLEACVLPVVRQYLSPSPDTGDWAITGAKAASLVAETIGVPGMTGLLERDWPRLADQLVETAKMSQPQQSKDFDKSQMHVASAGERWAALQRELFARKDTNELHAIFVTTDTKLVKECGQLLESREGKPFGAAAIIEELLRTCKANLTTDSDFKAAVEHLLTSDQLDWSTWPSRRQLVRALYAFSTEGFFTQVFTGALHRIIDQRQSDESAAAALLELFRPRVPEEALSIARNDQALQKFVRDIGKAGPVKVASSLVMDLTACRVLTDDTVDSTLSSLVESLAITEGADHTPRALEFFMATDNGTLKAAAASNSGVQLLPNLLKLEQHEDHDLAEKAAAISHRLSTAGAQNPSSLKFGVVLHNLENISTRSLSADAVNDLTTRLVGPERKVQGLKEMLPSFESWTSALRAVVRPPVPSLALLSPLGGAVHLVKATEPNVNQKVQVDAEGLSQALRIAMYISSLLADTDAKAHLHELQDDRWLLSALLYVTVLLAEDNLSVLGCNALWNPSSGPDVEPAVLQFVTEANAVLIELWDGMTPVLAAEAAERFDYTSATSALSGLRDGADPASAMHYYTQLASARLNANLFEVQGHNSEQAKASEGILRQHRSNKDALAMVACIVGLQHPLAGTQTTTRFCNELVADLTDLEMSETQHEQKVLEQLVLLNSILQTQEDAVGTIAKQRLIFLVKRLVPALSTAATSTISAEICKALNLLLPSMQDMYGEHWAQALSCLISFWSSVEGQDDGSAVNDGRVLVTHASLKLFATLRKLSVGEDANDDLVDAFAEERDRIHDALVTLLRSANGISDETDQPLMITHELLGRALAQLPYRPLSETEELFPLLYTRSGPVQQAAFNLLHKHIPAGQEEVSLNAALDDKTAYLPDELLSLILEAPTLDALVDASFDRSMPLQLQGYLYSWRLLFDHFTGASYRVKMDYIEQLKEGAYLPGLLSFTFDFLGHTRGRPVDASKFDVREYVPDTEPSPERDVQWLLAHLYYLGLMHVPSLVKSYYLDIRSRQTSLAVESWTAKYISPLIIATSLQAVGEWSEKSVKEDPEYEKMAVKVGMRSKEINVSYVVDEQTMAIKVALPEAYPLASAQVLGVSRVAVKEEKWQSWLRNCQGVITFSVSSLAYDWSRARLTCDRRMDRLRTACLLGGRTSLVRSRARQSVSGFPPYGSTSFANTHCQAPSATRSSTPRSNYQQSAARLARTCSTQAACSSGSRPATPAPVRSVGTLSTSTRRCFSGITRVA